MVFKKLGFGGCERNNIFIEMRNIRVEDIFYGFNLGSFVLVYFFNMFRLMDL